MLANRVRMGSSIKDSGLVVYDYGNAKFDTVIGSYNSEGHLPILQNDYIYFNHNGWALDVFIPYIIFNVKVQDFTKITIEYRHEESRSLANGRYEDVVRLYIVLNREFSDYRNWSQIKLDESLSKTTATIDIPPNNEDRYLGLATEIYWGEHGGYANIYKITLHN